MKRTDAKSVLKSEIKSFLNGEEGMGVIEVCLIISILIGLAIIFRKSVMKLLDDIFKSINNDSKTAYTNTK